MIFNFSSLFAMGFNIFTESNKRTMFFSKAVSGYHMLLILSAVDGITNNRELKVIRKYMSEHFNDDIDFDYETEVVRNIAQEDYPIHFNNAMNSFYLESQEADRNHFLDFAVKLVVADKNISAKENLFLNELYNAWEVS